MLKRIWKDPVWSKVIAGVILFGGSLLYAKFKSYTTGVTFHVALKGLVDIKISVVYVILILFLYIILRQILKKKDNFYTKNQEKLREFNSDRDTQVGILYKWNVYFDSDKPCISDFTLFCTKHGDVPIRFIDSKCPMNGCDNSRRAIYEPGAINLIESALIDKWEKIKKRN